MEEENNTLVVPVEKPNWPQGLLLYLIGMMIGGMLFGILIFTGTTNAFMTDGQCYDMINNATNISFINGTITGADHTKSAIIKEMMQCNEFPMSYLEYNYTLIAKECLQINEGGNK